MKLQYIVTIFNSFLYIVIILLKGSKSQTDGDWWLHCWLGSQYFRYENENGVIVTDVKPNSPAAEKGMRHGDLIVEVDRQRVKSIRDIENITAGLSPDSIVLFQIKRGSNNHFIALKLPK